jgi:hypothetical protein
LAAIFTTGWFNKIRNARTQPSASGLWVRATVMLLRALITPAFTSRDRQPLNLAADQLLKLVFPTLPGLGDKEES